MQRFKTYRYFQPHKLFLLLLALTVLLPAGGAFGQEKKKKKKKTKYFELRVGLAMTYDDNILKYSEKYLNRFMNGQDEGRFHIDTYDDLILLPSIRIAYTFHIFKKLRTIINGEFSHRAYVVNSIKNWDYLNIGIRQYFTKHASIKFFYSYIPNFYVRHFRDDEWVDIYGYTPETFQPFGFSKDNFGVWVQNTFLKNTRIRLSLYYSRYYYNKHFTEYDSKNFLYGIKLYQPLYKKLKLIIGYQFITSDAKAYDASHETIDKTTSPDASYEEDRFFTGINWKLPRIFNLYNYIEAEGGFFRRYYSSKQYLEIDRLHAGRVDDIYHLGLTYNIKLKKNLRISAYYSWFKRDSNTSAEVNKTYLSNEKDYKQYQIGLGITYKFKM